MGLGVSAAAAILFSAFIVIVGVAYTTVENTYDSLSDSQSELFERLSERSNTKIEISDVDYDADTITLTNNGSVILDLLELDLLLNGTPSNDAVSSMVVEGDSGTNLWAPSEELVINLSVDIVTERIKIITGNGISAYFGGL
jgi:flagellar protein FlaF